jgi:hypothetical protein
VTGMTPDEEAIKARMDAMAKGLTNPDAKTRLDLIVDGVVKSDTFADDVTYARMAIELIKNLDQMGPVRFDELETSTRVATIRYHSLCHTIVGQAAELESLRDKGDQLRPAPAGDLTQIVKGVRSAREAVNETARLTRAAVRELLDRIATELESLRDKESQPAPRVIATETDLAELPERSVIIGACVSGMSRVATATTSTATSSFPPP